MLPSVVNILQFKHTIAHMSKLGMHSTLKYVEKSAAKFLVELHALSLLNCLPVQDINFRCLDYIMSPVSKSLLRSTGKISTGERGVKTRSNTTNNNFSWAATLVFPPSPNR